MSFNLETAIETWRSVLGRRHGFFADDLEELENHLRDHTAQLIKEGHSEEEAFQLAQSYIGDFTQLEKAYRAVFWRKLKHRKQLIGNFIYQLSMFNSYFKLAVRNLLKHKGYSTINVSGLALGLACSFFIYLWIQHELDVDKFHERGDQLVQVKIEDRGGDRVSTWSNVPMPLASTLEASYPEVEHAILTLPISVALKGERHSSRESGYFAGKGFFDAFTFPFIAGDPSQSLNDPTSIVISEAVAEKYFGSDWQTKGDIIGQTMWLDYWQSDGGVLGQAVTVDSQKDFTIAGVFRNVPLQSSLRFDIVLPVNEVVQHFAHIREWGPRWFELTLALHPEADVSGLRAKIKPILSEYAAGAEKQDLILQTFEDQYLYSANGEQQAGRIQQVYIIGLIGLAILLIACINFANLATARSSQRAREIGVRKAMGATPSYLIQQFVGEALLTALAAFVLSIGLLLVFMPLFGSSLGIGVSISDLSIWDWLSFLAIAMLTGVIAGGYPAFYLASMRVIEVFRSQAKTRKRGEVSVRKGLVVFQFGVSAFLIVSTLTVYKQLNYLQTKDLGLDKENVVMVRMEGDMPQQFDAIRQTLLQDPTIEQVSRSSAHPLGITIKNSNAVWAGKELDENVLFTLLNTDARFFDTMKLQLSAGRFYDETVDGESLRYVINESAARAMGLNEPIGHPFAFGFEDAGLEEGQIIGMIKDFHTGSLRDEEISPLVIRYEPSAANFLLVRMAANKTADALRALERVQSTFNPGYEFDYTFLDEAYQAYYVDEKVLGKLSLTFAFLSIFIACLGLFGLSAFSVQQRTKEIGVRRVLGATHRNVVYMLSLEFVKPVLVALVLTLPLAYWTMQHWLTSFAYRVDVGGGVMMIAVVFSMIIVMISVGYQALRATRLNPVQSLKQE